MFDIFKKQPSRADDPELIGALKDFVGAFEVVFSFQTNSTFTLAVTQYSIFTLHFAIPSASIAGPTHDAAPGLVLRGAVNFSIARKLSRVQSCLIKAKISQSMTADRDSSRLVIE